MLWNEYTSVIWKDYYYYMQEKKKMKDLNEWFKDYRFCLAPLRL